MPILTTDYLTHITARTGKRKLPSYLDAGYPLLYLDGHDSVLCADCATKSLTDEISDSFRATSYDVYWEGAPIQCDQCSDQIESAYGDPEAAEG